MAAVILTIDATVNAAYIQLGSNAIVDSIQLNDLTVVDVDEFGMAAGIELLDETAEIPFGDLLTRFHVHSEVVETLRAIRPNPRAFVRLTQASDGLADQREDSPLTSI